MRKIVLELDMPVKRISVDTLQFESTEQVIAYQTHSGYWAVLIHNAHIHTDIYDAGFCYMKDLFKFNADNLKYKSNNKMVSVEKALSNGKAVYYFDNYEELCSAIAKGESQCQSL